MQIVMVNEGPFWEKHPDVYAGVTRYTDTDPKGHILECWERNEEGVMVDVTERERAKMELVKAQEALGALVEEDDDESY